MRLTDQEIVSLAQRAVEKDASAESALVESARSVIWPMIYHALPGEQVEDREDLLQTILLIFAMNVPEIANRAVPSPNAWMRQVTHKRIVQSLRDRYRDRRVRIGLDRGIDGENPIEPVDRHDLIQNLAEMESIERFMERWLTPRERELVASRKLDEWGVRQIAGVYDVDPGTVSRWFATIRDKWERFCERDVTG